MKITGPLLILLFALSLPAQAQVERNSRNLNSRRQAAGSNLPSGWLKPSKEPDGFKWTYRQEITVRRIFNSIQVDAQTVLASNREQHLARLDSIADDAASTHAPRFQFSAPKEPANSPVAEVAEVESDDAGQVQTDEPEEAAQALIQPDKELKEPDLQLDSYTPSYDFRIKPRTREQDLPAEDESEADGQTTDSETDVDTVGADASDADVDTIGVVASEAEALALDTHRLVDKALARLAQDQSEADGQSADSDADVDTVEADASDTAADTVGVDASEPETLALDTQRFVDEALASLERDVAQDRADTGFIPDADAAAEAALQLPAVPDSLDRSTDQAPARLVPSSGRLADIGSRQAPLTPNLEPDMPRASDFRIRSDISSIARGNGKLHQVALTFDDGPHPQYTGQILAILDYYNAPATFFFVGVQSSRYPEWLLMASQQGHEIGSQTYDHFRLPKLPLSEKEYQIDAYQDLVEQLTGERPRFLRPPGGQIDDASIELLKKRGMVCAMWDVALNDTHGNRSRDELLQHTLDSVRNGSVILAHDGVQATIDMLPELIERLREEGFELVTMSELASGL